ncbi:flap endonuclease-1 [Methanobrevibacter sp. 87.7]|uniref:flap endonuclease-1 n=1 Tax=Methanobrevibacter sp. 87.7 TaxID=387957 RepID=UPI000B50D6FE|nr:flap endonuclease-1 [Methanobrevibacter sp. 87.7]OWT33061.1 flap endonuclease-1 [Methanobrevibacter sp. 87.7]
MGVNFRDIASPEKIELKDIEGRTIAIDAYNTIYQFLSGIRQKDGTPLKDSDGNITSHLSGLLYRTSSIIEKGIKPIYVFDGKPSEYKADTIKKRKEAKKKSEIKMKEAIAEGDEELARKYAIRTSRMSPYIVESSKELLDYMGIPCIQASREGEAQASYMVQQKDAWGVSSQDYDCLLFGAPRIIRNLTLSGGLSKLEYMELNKVLKNLDFTREKLVDLALLVGTDFNNGVHGIGVKRGIKLLNEKSLEEILKDLDHEPETDIDILRNIFLKPNVNKDYKIKFKDYDNEKIIEFLCEEHGFGEDRVNNVLKNKMKNLNVSQKSLEDWF